MQLPDSLQSLIDQFSRFQGIGGKSAQRLVLQLTNWSVEELIGLSKLVHSLKDLKYCLKCGFFAESNICDICASERRIQSGVICVVESPVDCMAIESSEQYEGTYHILGGVLNPLMGIGPDELNMDQLIRRVKEDKPKNIILAINSSVEGDATCSYINEVLGKDVNVERIGFGIPMGGHLEYLDPMTISKAFENKKRL